jgi:long-subunit fatty acid transport protein
MGGAFLARADDATAASWNPAGLSYLKRPEFSLVGLGNTFRNTAANSFGKFTQRDTLTGYNVDFLALTYPINLASRSGAAQVSFQRVLTYDGDRTIRQPDRTFQLSSSGGFDVFAIGTGFQISRGLRVGATLNRWFNGYHQFTDRGNLGRANVRLLADLDLRGWNVNGGLIWTPFESLNIGAVFKTPFVADVTLTRQRTDTNAAGETTTNFSRSRSVTFDFPATAGAGLSWRPMNQLTVSMDYTLTQWRRGRVHNYFTLAPQGQPSETGDFYPVLPFPALITRQHNTYQTRAGVEYVLIVRSLTVPLRLGYFLDRQHFSDVDLRPPTFNGFTAGVGVVVGHVLLDGAFVLETGHYLDITGDSVDATIRRFLVSVIYRH